MCCVQYWPTWLLLYYASYHSRNNAECKAEKDFSYYDRAIVTIEAISTWPKPNFSWFMAAISDQNTTFSWFLFAGSDQNTTSSWFLFAVSDQNTTFLWFMFTVLFFLARSVWSSMPESCHCWSMVLMSCYVPSGQSWSTHILSGKCWLHIEHGILAAAFLFV